MYKAVARLAHPQLLFVERKPRTAHTFFSARLRVREIVAENVGLTMVSFYTPITS